MLLACRYSTHRMLYGSCGAKAYEAFEKKYPTFHITDVVPDGGAHDEVYYVIHYQKPNDERAYFGTGATENHRTGECQVEAPEQVP